MTKQNVAKKPSKGTKQAATAAETKPAAETLLARTEAAWKAIDDLGKFDMSTIDGSRACELDLQHRRQLVHEYMADDFAETNDSLDVIDRSLVQLIATLSERDANDTYTLLACAGIARGSDMIRSNIPSLEKDEVTS